MSASNDVLKQYRKVIADTQFTMHNQGKPIKQKVVYEDVVRPDPLVISTSVIRPKIQQQQQNEQHEKPAAVPIPEITTSDNLNQMKKLLKRCIRTTG